MPLRSPANCSSKLIPQRILALPLYIEPQPPLTRNQCWSCLNNFIYTSSKDQKSNNRILEAYNKTYYIRSNTFSPYNQCVRTKSGSCVKVSSILQIVSIIGFKLFNSLGLSSSKALISLTTTSPGLCLVPIQNNQVASATIPRPSTLPIILSKPASNA